MKKKWLYLLLVIIILSVVIILYLISIDSKISNFTMMDEKEKISLARAYGDEIIGWIRVEGTNIDMPLVRVVEQTNVGRSEYDFAWTHSFPDEKSNRPSFISHNIRNVSKNPIIGDDTMNRFEQLMSFIYPSFLQENQFIEYTDALGKTAMYRIYAVALLEDNQEASYSDTYSKEEQKEYIQQTKKDSMYTINVDVESDDLLLTLFTCTRFYGASTNYSFRVDARALRRGEKQTLLKVKKSKNYKLIETRMKEGEKNEKV